MELQSLFTYLTWTGFKRVTHPPPSLHDEADHPAVHTLTVKVDFHKEYIRYTIRLTSAPDNGFLVHEELIFFDSSPFSSSRHSPLNMCLASQKHLDTYHDYMSQRRTYFRIQIAVRKQTFDSNMSSYLALVKPWDWWEACVTFIYFQKYRRKSHDFLLSLAT